MKQPSIKELDKAICQISEARRGQPVGFIDFRKRSHTIAELKRYMPKAQSVSFDGEGHIFVYDYGSKEYEFAQQQADRLMRIPKSARPRGWQRGSDGGKMCFVKILMH